MGRVVTNYKSLPEEQRSRVPEESYKLAHKYLEMKNELSSSNQDNGDKNIDNSKN